MPRREIDIMANNDPIDVGATGETEIIQNVRTIISTLRHQVPLDRDFARPGDALDSPTRRAQAKEVAGIFRAIQRYEPRVEVTHIDFIQDPIQAMDGRLIPRVRIRIKDGEV